MLIARAPRNRYINDVHDNTHPGAIVYLIGAGPGDPELLTLRAVECLRRANLVIHDQLVNPRVLEHAPQAEWVCVGTHHGDHASRHAATVDLMTCAAKAGRTVVRLKGGDPGIFGRLGEEAVALAEAGVPFEIVPGVTAALGAGAAAGIPLTHRVHASAVAIVTGHECPGKAACSLDWSALARFPGTLVIYMGLKRLRTIALTLMQHGMRADMPAAVISRASTPQQRLAQASLADIADEAERLGLTPPAIVVIGEVVAMRERLSWFERRPLFGRTILLTRPAGQVPELQRRLEGLGATVVACSPITIGPAPDPNAVERTLERLHEFDWLVFTSANGVRAFMDALLTPTRDLRRLGIINLAAIGPRTADALRTFRLEPDLIPVEYRSEALLDALLPHVREQRVLLARADRGRELLFTELAKHCQVEELAVYRQLDAEVIEPDVLQQLRDGEIDLVMFTSSNIALSFVRLLDEPCRKQLRERTRVVTISPVTSSAVRELGFAVAAEAAVYTTEGIVEAILRLERG